MRKTCLALVLALSLLLEGCGIGGDPMAAKIAEAASQAPTQDGSNMDTVCRAYGVIAASLQGGDSSSLVGAKWTAWSDDPEKKAWTVSCETTYTVLTTQGKKTVTERQFLLLVDYDRWELRYVPGRAEEAQLLGVWGITLPIPLDPSKKP